MRRPGRDPRRALTYLRRPVTQRLDNIEHNVWCVVSCVGAVRFKRPNFVVKYVPAQYHSLGLLWACHPVLSLASLRMASSALPLRSHTKTYKEIYDRSAHTHTRHAHVKATRRRGHGLHEHEHGEALAPCCISRSSMLPAVHRHSPHGDSCKDAAQEVVRGDRRGFTAGRACLRQRPLQPSDTVSV